MLLNSSVIEFHKLHQELLLPTLLFFTILYNIEFLVIDECDLLNKIDEQTHTIN